MMPILHENIREQYARLDAEDRKEPEACDVADSYQDEPVPFLLRLEDGTAALHPAGPPVGEPHALEDAMGQQAPSFSSVTPAKPVTPNGELSHMIHPGAAPGTQ